MKLLSNLLLFITLSFSIYAQKPIERTAIEEAIVQYRELDNAPQFLLLEGCLQKSIQSFGKYDTSTIKVCKELGAWYFNNRDFKKSLELCLKEVKALEHLGAHPLKLSKAYTRTALSYQWLFKIDKAHEYYLKSIDNINDVDAYLNFDNYIGMAVVLYSQGNFNLLLDYSKLALDLAKTPEEQCEAYFYMFQGYARLRNKEECARVAELSINISKNENLDFYLGRAYTNLAWLRILERDYKGAISYYDIGVKLMEQSDFKSKQRNLAYSYSTMSHVYKNLKDSDKSIKYAKKAIAENKAFYNSTYHPDLARMYHNLASKYMWQDDYEAGLRHEQEAIISYIDDATFTDSRQAIPKDKLYGVIVKRDLLVSLSDKALSYASLYLNHKNKDDLISAETQIENAVELIDIMRSELSTKDTQLLWRRRTRRIYDTAVELADWLGDNEKILKYMEKSRSLLLMDELNHQDALSLLPEELREREKNLRDNFADAKEKDVAKYQRYNTFLDSLKEEYPSYYKYKFDVVTPSIEEIQNEFLTDSSNVLQYYLTGDSLYILNITNNIVELKTSPRPKDLETKVSELLNLVNNKDSLELKVKYDRFTELASSLQETLFGRIKNKRRHTTIIGDGIINYLPFDILMNKDDDAYHYLIEDHVFSTAPSLSVLKVNQNSSQNKFNNMLMVCPEEFSAHNLSPLVQSREEVTAFQNITDTEVLYNEEATVAKFHANCTNYDIIHFSTHSGIDKEVQLPWIAFKDSLITLNEIYKLNLNASLVTLSSCRSFDGKNNTSEGINSIARAFLFANASAVVGSLWDLNEASGFEILNDFYKGLKTNLDKPSSLRQAKLNYIQAHPYKSPYYWAPLVLIGDPSGLQTTHAESHIGILLLAIVAFFFLYRIARHFLAKG